MKEINQDDQKKVLVEMLQYVDKICRKNNINYFLLGGTLIGAIRHKGFIPWDDDIDICVPYKEYRKLIEILKEDNVYNVLNPYDNENYYYFFTKITDKRTVLIEDNFKRIDNMGIFLDIFPIYHLPDSEEELNKLNNKMKKLEKTYFRFYGFQKYFYDKNKLRRIIKAIVFFPQFIIKKKYRNYKKQLLDLIEECDNIQTNSVGNIISPSSIINTHKKEVYQDKTEVEFESLKVFAPIGYDVHLKKIFGDYMKLPPENQRVTEHHFKAYWKEDWRGELWQKEV